MPKTTFLILLTLLFPAILSSAQQEKVYGRVMNEEGQPIEYCMVRAGAVTNATYTNEAGAYALTYESDSAKQLIFSCMGYETKELGLYSDTVNVVLVRKDHKLNNVVIAGHQNTGKAKHGILGRKNLKSYGICVGKIGMEWAIYLEGNKERQGTLENIYYYITNEGIPSSRFRVHVYDVDTAYMPGNELLDSLVVLHGNTGNEWVGVDVSSKHIAVKGGLFVSMEWIAGYGNDEHLVKSAKYPAQAPFNGQVLSFTEGYHKQFSLSYCRGGKDRTWKYIVLAGSMKRNVLNPMVYATYEYFK